MSPRAAFAVPAVDGPLRTAVLGAGTMGRGIAQLLLQSGHEVTLIDPQPGALAAARQQLGELFTRLHDKGRLEQSPKELLARLHEAGDPRSSHDAEWIFEAATEDLELKRRLVATASEVAPQAALASNTSTLSVTAIAAAAARPEAVLGLHFFNPPGLMRLVEVVPGVQTLPALVSAATELVRRLGREPVVAKDSPGFIVNRLARPYYLEALRLHGSGVAADLIDSLMRAAGFRQGPFELLDLIGLDVNLAASLSVYRAFFEDPRYRPHPLQQAMVTAGLLGRKSGRGFYRYDADGQRLPSTAADPDYSEPDISVSPWRLAVIGETSAAQQLLTLLKSPGGEGPGPRCEVVAVDEADLIFDARLEPAPDEIAALLSGGARVALLTWARPVSLWAGRLADSAKRGTLLGFSLVPGAPNDTTTVELQAPLGAGAEAAAQAAELELIRRHLASAGVAAHIVPDVVGGIAFRIVALLANEALGALHEGLARAAELDLAMRLGVNYPRGPLAWAELIGLPELHTVLRGMQHEAPGGPYAPHALLPKLDATGSAPL